MISFYILKKGLNFNKFDSDLPFWLHSKGLPNHRPAIMGAKANKCLQTNNPDFFSSLFIIIIKRAQSMHTTK